MATPGPSAQLNMDAPDPLGGQWANASQFHGPHFICNLEGLVLEVKDKEVVSSKFHGGSSQQWLLQPDPSVKSRVALTSLLNGAYIEICRPIADGFEFETVQLGRTPFYWEIVEQGRIYRLGEGRGKLSLPLSPGHTCTIRTIASSREEDESVTLLILENTPEVQEALRIGKIGQWGYPGRSVYYTTGEAGQIRVYNHLDSPIYAAVSGQSGGSSEAGQWTVKANNWQYWKRSSNESVHVSLSDCIGAQRAQVFQGRVGKVLHVQSLPPSSEWEGIESIMPSNATYTENEAQTAQSIGIKNNLPFEIYVCVLSSRQGRWDNPQWSMSPGRTDFWQRQGPEVVLVSVGSAPGVPRAFLGKVGFTLHINNV